MLLTAPALTASRSTDAPAFWFLDILWIVLVDGETTGGRYSLMEQLMPEGGGPPPHVHPFNDEGFYVLDGALRFVVDGRAIDASAGASVWIPRGAVHEFKVTTPACRVLNTFTPAAMEQVIKALGRPAERRELPPRGLDVGDAKKLAVFANNYWGMEVSVPFAQSPLNRS